MSKIKIFALGGLNEEGKNMYVVKVDNDIFVFDAGLKYASDKLLGVDYVIPNFDYIKENIKNIKGLFITHGHEKNMGAVCDIIKEIPKKSGDYRELDIPSAELKYIQRWILDNILNKIRVSEFATGFCSKKSILNNAKIHINQKCIVNMDIKDFFPSISFEKTYRIFAYYGYTNEVSFILAKLCTFNGRLPQGSPASPYISNIACLKLDARLSALAVKYEAKYSRYADDITFSSKNDIKSIINIAIKIISDEQYNVNGNKTRIAYPHQRQEVTGLLVNGDKIRVSKKYKKDLYQELYYCKKFGVQSHLKKIGCNKAFYKEHIYGKIYFINMIEPEEAKKFFELADTVQWEY